MTDTSSAASPPADAQVLIRFYPGGTTVDLRVDDRWVPAELIPPADHPEDFDPEAYRYAIREAVEVVAFLVHLADVSRGKVV